MESTRAALDEKLFHEVRDMLKTVYSPKEVPHFEVNKTVISTLHCILKRMEMKQKINKELAKYYNNMAFSYSEKTSKLKNSLETVNLSLDNLPEDCQRAMKALATAACILNLKEPAQSNFLFALNRLSRENFEVLEEKRKLVQQQLKLTKKFQHVLTKIDALQKNVNSSKEKQDAQSAEVNKRVTQASFLQMKKEEYKKKAKGLEEKLIQLSYDSSIHHSELGKKHEEVLKLEEKLNIVSAKLNSYHNLPPNENLAKLKVEEARQELFNLQQEFQRNIEF